MALKIDPNAINDRQIAYPLVYWGPSLDGNILEPNTDPPMISNKTWTNL